MVEVFGFASVTAMVLFYTLEARSPAFVLAFAIACVAAASYAAMIGSWPFAAVESVWSVVAFRRWRHAVVDAAREAGEEPAAPSH